VLGWYHSGVREGGFVIHGPAALGSSGRVAHAKRRGHYGPGRVQCDLSHEEVLSDALWAVAGAARHTRASSASRSDSRKRRSRRNGVAANLNSTASIRPRSVRTGHCQPVAPGAPSAASAAPTARTTVSAQPIPPGLPPTASPHRAVAPSGESSSA